MRTLIINNNSRHLKQIISLFQDAVVISRDQIKTTANTERFDCIVLTGGSDVPTVLRHPEYYREEIELVRTTRIPILGICLGCELIVASFGGSLHELDTAHRGEVELTITDQSLATALGSNTLAVREGHTIGIAALPPQFESCAHSLHGTEIITHNSLPIIGLQFHPEIDTNQQLFGWILDTIHTTKKNLLS
jgi:GMP synthase-like glutamine amidotransferase